MRRMWSRARTGCIVITDGVMKRRRLTCPSAPCIRPPRRKTSLSLPSNAHISSKRQTCQSGILIDLRQRRCAVRVLKDCCMPLLTRSLTANKMNNAPRGIKLCLFDASVPEVDLILARSVPFLVELRKMQNTRSCPLAMSRTLTAPHEQVSPPSVPTSLRQV